MNLQQLLDEKQAELKKITAQVLEINNSINKAKADVDTLSKNYDYIRGQSDLIEQLLKEEK